jgi:hypothetical protein
MAAAPGNRAPRRNEVAAVPTGPVKRVEFWAHPGVRKPHIPGVAGPVTLEGLAGRLVAAWIRLWVTVT